MELNSGIVYAIYKLNYSRKIPIRENGEIDFEKTLILIFGIVYDILKTKAKNLISDATLW